MICESVLLEHSGLESGTLSNGYSFHAAQSIVCAVDLDQMGECILCYQW